MFTAVASPVIVAVAETWCDLHSFFPSGRNLALAPIEAMLAGSVECWVKAGSSSTGTGHFLLSLEISRAQAGWAVALCTTPAG